MKCGHYSVLILSLECWLTLWLEYQNYMKKKKNVFFPYFKVHVSLNHALYILLFITKLTQHQLASCLMFLNSNVKNHTHKYRHPHINTHTHARTKKDKHRDPFSVILVRISFIILCLWPNLLDTQPRIGIFMQTHAPPLAMLGTPFLLKKS